MSLLIGLFAYLCVMIFIGIWSSRRVQGIDDFLLGGRRLGPWVTAVSERASGESSWFLMGLPAAAYGAAGFFEFWSVIGIASGILVSWVLIARPLREASGATGALTLPQYFAERFPRMALPLRSIAALSIVVFYVSYLGAQLKGASLLFDFAGAESGWIETPELGPGEEPSPPLLGITLAASVVVLYTLLGGFLAVAWTDLLQGILMVMVAVGLPLLAIAEYGWDEIVATISATRGPGFWAMGNFAVDKVASGLGIGAIIGSLAWGLGYLGQPHLLTRYMAIEDPRDLRRSTGIAMSWVLLAYWGVMFAGITAVHVVSGLEGDDAQLVLLHSANALLPQWLAGFVIAGVLAAIMSSADSQLLVATSAVAEDIGARLCGLRLSRAKMVLFTRVVTVVLTLVALYPLLSGQAVWIYDAVAYAWTGLGSTFGPALIAALWWRRTSGVGVLCGMVGGIGATILWQQGAGGVALLEAIDGKVAPFLVSTLGVVAGSLLVPERRTET